MRHDSIDVSIKKFERSEIKKKLLEENVESEEYFKLYYSFKRSNRIKTWLSMAGLVITLINYEVHMNDLLTHYDYKNFGETQIEEFHFSKTYAG